MTIHKAQGRYGRCRWCGKIFEIPTGRHVKGQYRYYCNAECHHKRSKYMARNGKVHIGRDSKVDRSNVFENIPHNEDGTCGITDCNRKARIHGLCGNCYSELYDDRIRSPIAMDRIITEHDEELQHDPESLDIERQLQLFREGGDTENTKDTS